MVCPFLDSGSRCGVKARYRKEECGRRVGESNKENSPACVCFHLFICLERTEMGA